MHQGFGSIKTRFSREIIFPQILKIARETRKKTRICGEISTLIHSTVVFALANPPREAQNRALMQKRALKLTFYKVKIDLVIASQGAVIWTVH